MSAGTTKSQPDRTENSNVSFVQVHPTSGKKPKGAHPVNPITPTTRDAKLKMNIFFKWLR